MPALAIASRTPSATSSIWATVPYSSGSKVRVLVTPIARRGSPVPAWPLAGLLMKSVTCGHISPAVPPIIEHRNALRHFGSGDRKPLGEQKLQ